MRRTQCLPALALLTICGFSTTSGNEARSSRTETEVRALLQRQVDAWNRGDLDGFLDAYWDSSEVTFFSNGRNFRGRAEIAALMRDRYKQGTGRLAFGEPHFEVVGSDVAVAWGEWAVQLPGGQERRGLGTAVFRKLNGGWRIVHDHSSFGVTATPPERKP